jgi:N-acetylneuraminic acid mutarotase
MSSTGAPPPRAGATAVWTGSLFVIWGGQDPNTNAFVGSGGAYDPVSDSWTSLSSTGAPVARSGHAAAWTGSRMLIWGGTNTSGPSFPDPPAPVPHLAGGALF